MFQNLPKGFDRDVLMESGICGCSQLFNQECLIGNIIFEPPTSGRWKGHDAESSIGLEQDRREAWCIE